MTQTLSKEFLHQCHARSNRAKSMRNKQTNPNTTDPGNESEKLNQTQSDNDDDDDDSDQPRIGATSLAFCRPVIEYWSRARGRNRSHQTDNTSKPKGFLRVEARDPKAMGART